MVSLPCSGSVLANDQEIDPGRWYGTTVNGLYDTLDHLSYAWM